MGAEFSSYHLLVYVGLGNPSLAVSITHIQFNPTCHCIRLIFHYMSNLFLSSHHCLANSTSMDDWKALINSFTGFLPNAPYWSFEGKKKKKKWSTPVYPHFCQIFASSPICVLLPNFPLLELMTSNSSYRHPTVYHTFEYSSLELLTPRSI